MPNLFWTTCTSLQPRCHTYPVLKSASAPGTCRLDSHNHGSASCSGDALLGWASGQPVGTKAAGHCGILESPAEPQDVRLLAVQSRGTQSSPASLFTGQSKQGLVSRTQGRGERKRWELMFLSKVKLWKPAPSERTDHWQIGQFQFGPWDPHGRKKVSKCSWISICKSCKPPSPEKE